LPSIELYALVYPFSNPTINYQISRINIGESSYGAFCFYRANVYAKEGVKSAFDLLEKAINNGYAIPEKYRANFISNLDSEKYDKILLENNYKPIQQVSKTDPKLKSFVENKINDWQQKGKFEKSLDYQLRVSSQLREKKITELVQTYIDSIGLSQVDLTKAINEYDADNEVFKIIFDNLNKIYLPVPISEAPIFDKNFKTLHYENPVFTIYDGSYEILHLEVTNPANNKKYSYDSKDVIAFSTTELELKFDELELELEPQQSVNSIQEGVNNISVGVVDVDENIPTIQNKNNSKYALIIGNEQYENFQTGLKAEQNVEFAENDAEIFREYCLKTLGIPEENIIFEKNCGVVRMQQSISQINSVVKTMNGEAEVVFYYAGHGFPNENTKEPCLIPVDVSSTSINMAISLNSVIEKLTQYPSKRVILFVDACFSGGGRNMGLLASRGIKIVPKNANLLGNVVMFSASSAEQSSLAYNEKRHGLFTYFLLKKLQESEGKATLQELEEYLSKQVSIKSALIHSREQNPEVHFNPNIKENWRAWNL
ncbi:MAG: caspase family protein, partial [Salinivirgaceae bacterium]|nr:caspase family protein [Salinivirgaceae bacterium]